MKNSLLFSFQLILAIGFVTAAPLLILGSFGRSLDSDLTTGHDFLYLAAIISIAITYFSIRKIVAWAVTKLQ